MEQSNKKILTLAFAAAAFLAGFVVSLTFDALAGTFAFVARAYTNEVIAHGLPVAVGFLTFAILQFSASIGVWADEVLLELRKVVWPSRRDTIAMATVVCVMLLLAAAILGVFDFLSGNLIRFIVN